MPTNNIIRNKILQKIKQSKMYSEIEKVKIITSYSATSEITMYVLAA